MIIRKSSLAVAFLCAVLSFCAGAANNLGDFAPSTVVYGKFTTYRPSTGAAFTLAGSPVLSVYKDNSTTQSTTGVTLTADFDSVTGFNHFAIDTSADGTFYSAGSNFDIVVTTGTVDSVSVVGTVVGSFTIDKTMALKPTTAGRKLDVSSGGEAGLDWANIGSPTTSVNLSGTTVSSTQSVNVTQFGGTNGTFASGRPEVNMTHIAGSAVSTSTAQLGVNVVNFGGSAGTFASGVPAVNATQISGDATAADNVETAFDDTAGPVSWQGIARQGTAQSATGTTLVLDSAASFADDTTIGMTIVACGSTQGYCQARTVTGYVGSTDTATVDTWTVTPSGTITYKMYGTAPASGSGSAPSAATVADAVWDEARSGHVASGSFGEYTNANLTNIGGSAVSTSTAQLGVNVVNFGGSAGTFASGRPETNMTHIAGSAVSTSSAQLGVNIVNAAGTAWNSGSIGASTIATDAIGAAELASDAGTELGTAVWATTTRSLTILDEDSTTLDLNATAIGSVATGVTVTTNNDKTGYTLSTSGLNGIRDLVVEDQGSLSLGCVLAAIAASTAGDISTSGQNTTMKEASGAEDRITVVVTSNGNRTSTITCPTYP